MSRPTVSHTLSPHLNDNVLLRLLTRFHNNVMSTPQLATAFATIDASTLKSNILGNFLFSLFGGLSFDWSTTQSKYHFLLSVDDVTCLATRVMLSMDQEGMEPYLIQLVQHDLDRLQDQYKQPTGEEADVWTLAAFHRPASVAQPTTPIMTGSRPSSRHTLMARRPHSACGDSRPVTAASVHSYLLHAAVTPTFSMTSWHDDVTIASDVHSITPTFKEEDKRSVSPATSFFGRIKKRASMMSVKNDAVQEQGLRKRKSSVTLVVKKASSMLFGLKKRPSIPSVPVPPLSKFNSQQ